MIQVESVFVIDIQQGANLLQKFALKNAFICPLDAFKEKINKKILTKIFTRKHKKEEKNIIEDDEEKQKKNDKEKEIELDKISEEGSNLIKQGDKFL